MANRFVTVASYTFAPEAQMARNFLEAEGIEVFLAGEMTAEVLVGIGDEVHLQVREKDAQRAVSLLASAEAALDPNWETQAESGAGIWPCPVCDTAVSKQLNVCPTCLTPNQHITTDRRETWPSSARPRATSEDAKGSEQVRPTPPSSARPGAEEAPSPTPPSGAGCAGLLALLVLVPLWLWWR